MIEDIVVESVVRAPPDAVWRVLAHGDAMGAWLMDNDLSGEAHAGARFSFRDRPRPFWDGVCPIEVLTAEAPSRLVLRWNARGSDDGSQVSFTLTPTTDGGTHIAFRHAGLHGVQGWFMKVGMTKGWQGMVARGIPFVVDALGRGALPTRQQVREASRASS